MTGEKSATYYFSYYRKGSQQQYFGHELQKFNEFASRGKVNVTEFPLEGNPGNPFGSLLNWPLAPIGWLTSPYLFGFYNFGYVFTMQDCMDSVWVIIQLSFSGMVNDRLNYDEMSSTCAALVSEPINSASEPTIGLTVTANDELQMYEEISFLRYRIRPPAPVYNERDNLAKWFREANSLPEQVQEHMTSFSLERVLLASEGFGRE